MLSIALDRPSDRHRLCKLQGSSFPFKTSPERRAISLECHETLNRELARTFFRLYLSLSLWFVPEARKLQESGWWLDAAQPRNRCKLNNIIACSLRNAFLLKERDVLMVSKERVFKRCKIDFSLRPQENIRPTAIFYRHLLHIIRRVSCSSS